MPIRRKLAAALDRRRLPHDRVLSPYTCLLIESGRDVALVDTGGGATLRTSGAIVARLEMAGLRPCDIDTVILTHAHPDHTGGAVEAGGRPRFFNARHVISECEVNFWMAAHPDLTPLRVPPEAQVFDGEVRAKSSNQTQVPN
jgi:glyoxylase-like metal-dependent hydrolase (beta-lactamase superfamily II)